MRTATASNEPRRAATMALMYHAILARDDNAMPAGIDRRYAIEQGVFAHQLDLCCAHGALVSARDWLDGRDGTILTFDDGDASHYRHALPVLLDHAATADFFVNPATVGQAGYVGWSELREMAQLGMSIQSHGFEHRYFTGYSATQLGASLLRARSHIEQAIGTRVSLLAPPGGRMPPRMAALALECGYSHVLCSRPGRIKSRSASVLLPRIAVTCDTATGSLLDWLQGRGIARLQARYAALDWVKRALGDRLYERLRGRALHTANAAPC